MPAVNFGDNIEFNIPKKPFIAPLSEKHKPEFIPEPMPEVPQQTLNSVPSTGTAAIYDRNWLLQ